MNQEWIRTGILIILLIIGIGFIIYTQQQEQAAFNELLKR